MSTRHATTIAENTVGKKGTGERTNSAKKNYLAIVAALVLLYILWGTTYLGVREALHSFPPFLLAGIRALVAGILLFAILRARGAAMPTRKEWFGAAIVGVLLLVGGNAQVSVAEQWVSSGLTAVALGAVPLWTALFAGLFGRWPNRFEWCGLALGFAGLILLNVGHGITATNPLGIIVLLLAPICWSFGSIVGQRVSQPEGLMAPAVQLLCGGIILIPLGLATGERVTAMPTPASIGWMVFLIVGGSLVAFTAYAYLLSHVRPALATSYAYVNPLIAVFLGVWLDSEKMNLVGIIATLIILSGVVLVTTLGRPHGH